jgi:hypothetical protein
VYLVTRSTIVTIADALPAPRMRSSSEAAVLDALERRCGAVPDQGEAGDRP